MGQGPTAHAVGVGGGVWMFLLPALAYHFSSFSFSGGRPDID